MALLEIKGLKTHFKTDDGWLHAVDGVDLHIDAGLPELGLQCEELGFASLRLVGELLDPLLGCRIGGCGLGSGYPTAFLCRCSRRCRRPCPVAPTWWGCRIWERF